MEPEVSDSDRGQSDVQVFDLSDASARQYRSTRRSRWVSIGAVVFLIFWGLFFDWVNWAAIENGSLSGYQKFDLTVVTIIVVFGLVLLLFVDIPKRVRGAVSLRLDSSGIQLTFLNGRKTKMDWTDSELEFRLIDFSGATSKWIQWPDLPQSILVHRVESRLTPAAYEAILGEIAHHGLIDQVTKGGRWLYPSDANPTIRVIHGLGGSPHFTSRR